MVNLTEFQRVKELSFQQIRFIHLGDIPDGLCADFREYLNKQHGYEYKQATAFLSDYEKFLLRHRFHVSVQTNNGDPCPKNEYDAWNWDEEDFATLADAISYLISAGASGFTITDCLEDNVVVEKIVTHCS